MSDPVYLDHNATTPLAPEVADAMEPFLRSGWGNPSSGHAEGRRARDALAKARREVADLLGASPEEIVFTSGGSEANNHAIVGTLDALAPGRRHIVTTAIEHPAVLEPCRYLVGQGRARLTVVDVDGEGVVSPEAVAAALAGDTALLTVMHSNNETGALQPVAALAREARARGVRVHTDAAQSVGKVRVDVNELGVDLLTVVGHKLYGPKGVGALYVREGTTLEPFVHGAGQEGGRRAGTENVLLAVGLGAACALAQASLDEGRARMRERRDALHRGLVEALGDRVVLNGPPEDRLPNTLNVCIRGVVGADVLARAADVAASTGSACHEGTVHLSPVLAAMGVDPELGRGALRLTVGRTTSDADVARAAAALVGAVRALDP